LSHNLPRALLMVTMPGPNSWEWMWKWNWDGEIFQRQQMKPLASRSGCGSGCGCGCGCWDVRVRVRWMFLATILKCQTAASGRLSSWTTTFEQRKTGAVASTLGAFSGPITQVAKLGN